MNVKPSVVFGERYIVLSQVAMKGELIVPSVLAFEKIPVNFYINEAADVEDKCANTIQKMMKDAGLTVRNASLVIPDSKSYTSILEMPTMTEKELSSAIRYHADQFIPIPIEKVSLDLEIMHEDKQNKKLLILLVATANSIVDKVTEIAEKADLLPESLENETSAFFRLAGTIFKADQKNPAPDHYLFINFGFSSSSFYLFSRATQLFIQTHNFPVGFDVFSKELRSNYSLVEADADHVLSEIGFSNTASPYKITDISKAPYGELVQEAERFILSAKEKGTAPIKIFLFGEGSTIRDLSQRLSTSLGIAVELFSIHSFMAVNTVSDYFKKDLPILTTAIGAGLRQ